MRDKENTGYFYRGKGGVKTLAGDMGSEVSVPCLDAREGRNEGNNIDDCMKKLMTKDVER